MKLTLVAVLLLAVGAAPEGAVRFESDGVRVGSELVTGAAVSLKESGATPLLVSGSVVESLSGESLKVSLGVIPRVRTILSEMQAPLVQSLCAELDDLSLIHI